MSIHRISLQCLARLTGSPSSTACKSAECCNSLSRFRRSKRDSQRPIVRWPGLTCVLVLLCTYPALADNPPIKENLATAGDAALQSNDNNLAIDKYTAIIQPSDETIYNLGIAHYRNGDIQQAAEQFRMVIGSQNDSLAARARFNLGNAFYSQALTQLKPPAADNAAPTSAQATTATTPTASQDVESGVKLLRSAITQYRSALRIDANDTDARANIELAQSLIDEIEQQQDQQQQDQQQQDQQQQDQQQQDQQQQDQQQQDQQQQDQENKSNQKITNAEEQADSKDDSDDSSDPPSGELTAVNEQDAATDQAHGEPTLIKTDQMTEEEARKLLQSIRDRDMLRRLRKQAAERALRVPVERDW